MGTPKKLMPTSNHAFRDRVVVITGSAQGIGYAVAEMLASRGAYLILNARRSEKVAQAKAKLLSITPHVDGLAGDVSDESFTQELVRFAIERFGRLDILINNAGVAAGGLFKDTQGHAFRKVIDINLLGSVYPTLAALPELTKTQGSILFIGSVAGFAGLPRFAAYSSSKRALVNLAESLRTECWDEGVFVGIHYPGFTENEADKTTLDPMGREVVLQKRPGVRALSREQTATKILNQLEKRRFRMYSSKSAMAVDVFYRWFPGLFMRLIVLFRARIMAMQ
ncbi:MAG: SDR family NAD(P)-dependent oxidoreductase [Sphingobacteriia bacterium]|nr:SDR family NAD(P)-dependent oxidoreductase [Sphingobacteriia bacterium]